MKFKTIEVSNGPASRLKAECVSSAIDKAVTKLLTEEKATLVSYNIAVDFSSSFKRAVVAVVYQTKETGGYKK